MQWAEVKFGENLNARVEFAPVVTAPDATVTLVRGSQHSKGTLRVWPGAISTV